MTLTEAERQQYRQKVRSRYKCHVLDLPLLDYYCYVYPNGYLFAHPDIQREDALTVELCCGDFSLAEELVYLAEKKAIELGLEYLTLYSHSDSQSKKRFKELGFLVEDTLVFGHKETLEMVLMVKKIPY
jgi:hypothetical protein